MAMKIGGSWLNGVLPATSVDKSVVAPRLLEPELEPELVEVELGTEAAEAVVAGADSESELESSDS